MANEPGTTVERGEIIAACGHEVPSVHDLIDVRFGDVDCGHDGFRRVVIYGAWCQPCAERLRASGDMIETDEQEQEWFNGPV